LGRTTPSSATPASTDFATVKVKREFLSWLKRESARRGIFIYELVEEMASVSLTGSKPWRRQPSPSSGLQPADQARST